MPQHYDETFKKQIVRLRLKEGRSIRSIIEEYGMSKASIINQCNEFREECQNDPESQNEYDSMKEIRKLRKEMEELRKENLFLKKAAAFFAKEIEQRLIGSSKNIIMNLACAGCCVNSTFAPMPTTTS